MTDTEFLLQADLVLRAIEAAADASEDDIEPTRSGNVVTLEFTNGSQIIVNLQQPLHEIWVAARSGGFHFRAEGDQWRDTRSGRELTVVLGDAAREQAQSTLDVQLQPLPAAD